MRAYIRMFITLLLSCGLALLMASLPSMNSSKLATYGKDLSTLANDSGRLSDQNLVDGMVQLPLQLNIKRVDWQQSILSVDLIFVPGKRPDNEIAATVFHDLYELSQFGLFNRTNVNQVLIRIMEQSTTKAKDNGGELLLAMDSRKENLSKQEQKSIDAAQSNPQQYLQSHYRFTYTQKWKDHFTFPSAAMNP